MRNPPLVVPEATSGGFCHYYYLKKMSKNILEVKPDPTRIAVKVFDV